LLNDEKSILRDLEIFDNLEDILKDFGGNWTEQKLNAFIKYVKAYLTILNKVKTRYNWQTIYFDGFAGYGKRESYSQDKNFSLDIFKVEEKEEIFVYEGSVTRILNLEEPYIFDWYYFIDTNKEYVSRIEQLREKVNHIS
jgi:three-Cys-motif partner protein